VTGSPAPSDPPVLLLTCEHAGRRVPPEYTALFGGREALLASHRGWDPGAMEVAEVLARRLRRWRSGPVLAHPWTRLLADVNRSPDHPRVFWEEVRALPARQRAEVLAAYHRPHREAVRSAVAEEVAAGRGVVQVGVHTFTPVLDGRPRTTDIGVLYDPARLPERSLADAWCRGLRIALPERRIHRNRPYRGTSDGLTTWLRASFAPAAYLGLELEVNTRLLDPAADGGGPELALLAGTLADALGGALGGWASLPRPSG